MKYLDYQEMRPQGTFEFPIAFYHINPSHPRYQMTYHWHKECEMIRILEGSFLLTIDNNSYHLKKGDLIFIQDGFLHGGIPSECIYECIVFDMLLLMKNNHICSRQIQSIIHHERVIHAYLSRDIPALNDTVTDLFTAMGAKKPGYEFIIQGSLFHFFGIVLEHELYQTHPASSSVSTNRLAQLKNVLSYIEEHYQETISLDDMARIAGMNSKYFCRYFRAMTQRTPTNYLNYYRIECACELLSTKDLTITEVAFCCGFNDISYFIKSFHKYKGITPKRYMINHFSQTAYTTSTPNKE